MKFYSLLLCVLLVTGCSDDNLSWKQSGFNQTQKLEAKEMGFKKAIDYQEALNLGIKSYSELIAFRDKAKESGFENTLDYKEALDLEINTFSQLIDFRDKAKEGGFKNPYDYKEALSLGLIYDDWMIYKEGNFISIEQFDYAKKYNLQSKIAVIWHMENCINTPSFGMLCNNSEKYNELDPRLEYHFTRLNEALDKTEFEIALDCSTIKTPYKFPYWKVGQFEGYEGHYKTILLDVNGPLIYAKEKALLNKEFYPLNNDGNPISPGKLDNSDAFRGLKHVNVGMAIMFFEQYTRRYVEASGYVSNTDIPPHEVILPGYWLLPDDFYTFVDSWNGITHIVDRKTGTGKITKQEGRFKWWDPFQGQFVCKAFEGDIKNLVKNEVFKPTLRKVLSQQIEALNKKKAEELAKKKREEERNKLEYKF